MGDLGGKFDASHRFEERLRRETLGVQLSFGRVVVSDQVLAYQRKRLPSNEVIDLNSLTLPKTQFSTQALWF